MLNWQAAALIGVACFVVATVAERVARDADGAATGNGDRGRASRVIFAIAPFGREIGIIFGLYALWQLAGGYSLGHTDEAVKRGQWIWAHERAWHFPSEAALQRPILGHPLLVQVANIYYATMHFGMLLAVLLWLFIRHRDAYRRTRTLIVLTTTACLLVALIPVSPPRLINVGMVDTAAAYGQSVYAATGQLGADQYSAMPSVHVAWAFLVAIAVIGATRSRWRWLILLHTIATVYFVVVTANHFWLDGVVAVGLLGISLAIQVFSRRIVQHYRQHNRRPIDERPDAELESVDAN
jgi:PAP2 superfamily